MGSSIVTIWSGAVSLMCVIIAASVVDLPLPVGPVTSTSPWGAWQMSLITAGMPRPSSVGVIRGMTRSAAPNWPRSLNAFRRKRATSPISYDASTSNSAWSRVQPAAPTSFWRTACMSCSVSGGNSLGRRSLEMRMRGGRPTLRWRSDPRRPTSSFRMASMSIILVLHAPDQQVPRGPPDALHELDLVALELVAPRLVDQLHHAVDPVLVDYRHGQKRPRLEAERLGERGGVARIAGDVAHRQRPPVLGARARDALPLLQLEAEDLLRDAAPRGDERQAPLLLQPEHRGRLARHRDHGDVENVVVEPLGNGG